MRAPWFDTGSYDISRRIVHKKYIRDIYIYILYNTHMNMGSLKVPA